MKCASVILLAVRATTLAIMSSALGRASPLQADFPAATEVAPRSPIERLILGLLNVQHRGYKLPSQRCVSVVTGLPASIEQLVRLLQIDAAVAIVDDAIDLDEVGRAGVRLAEAGVALRLVLDRSRASEREEAVRARLGTAGVHLDAAPALVIDLDASTLPVWEGPPRHGLPAYIAFRAQKPAAIELRRSTLASWAGLLEELSAGAILGGPRPPAMERLDPRRLGSTFACATCGVALTAPLVHVPPPPHGLLAHDTSYDVTGVWSYGGGTDWAHLDHAEAADPGVAIVDDTDVIIGYLQGPSEAGCCGVTPSGQPNFLCPAGHALGYLWNECRFPSFVALLLDRVVRHDAPQLTRLPRRADGTWPFRPASADPRDPWLADVILTEPIDPADP